MSLGDVVRLNLGGPPMTSQGPSSDTHEFCSWFDGDHPIGHAFPAGALTTICGADSIPMPNITGPGQILWLRSGSPPLKVVRRAGSDVELAWSSRSGFCHQAMLTETDPMQQWEPVPLTAPASSYPPLGSRVIALHHPGVWTVMQYTPDQCQGIVMACKSDDGRVMCLGPDELRLATWRDEKPLF